MEENHNKYYEKIKDLLLDNKVYKATKDYSKNRSDIMTYYQVGKELYEAGKSYGENIVKKFSKDLYNDTGLKYSPTSLRYMRLFYAFFEKCQPVVDISWSHYTILLPLKDINKINYYIGQITAYNLSKRQLKEKIKSEEYERLDKKTREKLINKEEKYEITDYIKHPIVIKSKKAIPDKISEKFLKNIILENIDEFLLELGPGFTYVTNEYKIDAYDVYNYIDILLFNIEYNCYVVVELKVTDLKKEHIGQIQIYMNYINKNLRKITQDKTIGIIICKKEIGYVIEYASDPRIIATSYILQ